MLGSFSNKRHAISSLRNKNIYLTMYTNKVVHMEWKIFEVLMQKNLESTIHHNEVIKIVQMACYIGL